MKNVYTKVTQIAREQLYQFMKDNQVSPLNYHFHYYFDDCIQKFGIKVMEHHFTNRKIEGLTMIDEDGISISYESQNPQVKQNFTKCHELGHYILGHSGKQFTQLSSKKDTVEESQANIFSAYILMPDIALLSKIYYRLDSFKRVMTELSVSADALKFRLQDLFRYRLKLDNQEISSAIYQYQTGQSKSVLSLFEELHTEIEDEYRAVEEDVLAKVLNRLRECYFVASTEFPELLENSFRKELEQEDDIDTWLEYDFEQSVGYAWRTDMLTAKQAKLRAKTILLLEKR
ncbi:ImmA/IrrE family metallo-endopeptidase [Streptococcus infantarius]|uniref:ImmA/IrrE family metallo-endopeptidase n=1 Tax=Streptococcus infantarius TaxID=102684 RepID=UPI0022E904B1|nr:ImmA/IrrE family metallo-endopeptidase [Streptococcus infantarius]